MSSGTWKHPKSEMGTDIGNTTEYLRLLHDDSGETEYVWDSSDEQEEVLYINICNDLVW